MQEYSVLPELNIAPKDLWKFAVSATDTTLVTIAMLQATHLGSKRHHTPKASSKVCELEKDRGATALAGQVVKSKAGIAA